MIFKTFTELVNKINTDLGGFCNQFQYKRKELTGADRTAGNGKLFGNIKEDGSWAINKGAGTEIQYHIVFDKEDSILYYGLGFNTQYVQFANKMSMVDYVRPFMNAFLNLEIEISKRLTDYSYFYGTRDSLVHPQEGKYILYGKKINATENSIGEYEIDDALYNTVLNDLKKQFEPYVQIFELRNKLITMIGIGA